MTARSAGTEQGVARFRARLFATIMLIVCTLTLLGLYVAHRRVTEDAQRDLEQDFRAQLSSLHELQNLRHTALVERCRLLVAKPRLHAALEDNALDLLYPTARDELRELRQGGDAVAAQPNRVLRAKFYRFLDPSGAVIPAPDQESAGTLAPDDETGLSLPGLPHVPQTGYLPHGHGSELDGVDEVVAVPIFSTETGDVISALVVGFRPLQVAAERDWERLRSGIWVEGSLYLPDLAPAAHASVSRAVALTISHQHRPAGNFKINTDGAPNFLFFQRLNPESVFRPAYEICLYPLAQYESRQRRILWQVGGAGALLLLAGLGASHLIAQRLSAPVEKLAVDSAQHRLERSRAEAALVSTSEELERSSRYSADASHQLKSPVTVLRAGLEALLGRSDFAPEVYDEISTLLHQTYRLTGVIDDLLLLSRMEAGHLRIEIAPVDLGQLVDEWLEDLSAMPDTIDLRTEKALPHELYVAGERRYTSLIVQNLLENARKYNRLGGLIRIGAVFDGDFVSLKIGNTGPGIPERAQATIFERFHRGGANDQVAGHGVGLNLARELTRLHGGELRLVESRDDWTEFEVRFRTVRTNGENNPGEKS